MGESFVLVLIYLYRHCMQLRQDFQELQLQNKQMENQLAGMSSGIYYGYIGLIKYLWIKLKLS